MQNNCSGKINLLTIICIKPISYQTHDIKYTLSAVDIFLYFTLIAKYLQDVPVLHASKGLPVFFMAHFQCSRSVQGTFC